MTLTTGTRAPLLQYTKAASRRNTLMTMQVLLPAFVLCMFSSPVLSEQITRDSDSTLVCITVTLKDYLSGPAFRALQEEATRIWVRQRIALTWTDAERARCADTVPVVFDEEQLHKLADTKDDSALARTAFSGRTRVIYVGVRRGFQMLSRLSIVNAERDLSGGRLLGRVVAHELGHVLLTTVRHSKRGLMRPVLDWRDLLAGDDRAIDLEPAETMRLTQRFSPDPLDPWSAPGAIARRKRGSPTALITAGAEQDDAHREDVASLRRRGDVPLFHQLANER